MFETDGSEPDGSETDSSESARPEFWQRVRTVFQGAIELSPSERERHLHAACGDDTAVRAEVESLLLSHEEAGDFIERPPRFRSTFPAGELVAGRYTIVRMLGEGGMGEVYEAEDRELGESVALKIIRPQIASDPLILQRFRREIQLARKVTHPNVCRIFDVFHHLSSSGGSTPDRRIAFVSMELLHGETLAQRLARTGRMQAAEALPIVRQLAAGLAAAHEAGIVPRDFKAANVMLVADGEPAARRAVAVLGLRNLSRKASTAWMSSAFAEMLTSELAGGERLRPIAGDEVERIRGDLSLADADSLSPAILQKIRARAGANLVVTGSYLAVGEPGSPVRLELRLHDTEAGTQLLAFSEAGRESDLADIAARAGDRIRRQLGIEAISTAEKAGIRAALPANPESVRAYAEGLDQLRRYDAISARSLLEKAIEEDPTNPMAHAALSQALSNLGFERLAGEEARKASELSSRLPRACAAICRGRSASTKRPWPSDARSTTRASSPRPSTTSVPCNSSRATSPQRGRPTRNRSTSRAGPTIRWGSCWPPPTSPKASGWKDASRSRRRHIAAPSHWPANQR